MRSSPLTESVWSYRLRAGRGLYWIGWLRWVFMALSLGAAARAEALPRPLVLRLWADGPMGPAADPGEERMEKDGSAAWVSVPEMSVYLADHTRATGRALLVCAGGSYTRVGRYATGMGTVAEFLPEGTTVIVLKYRTGPPSADVMTDALADAKRAVRLARHHATSWGIDPRQIGLIGSSAGAHLILNLATHADEGDPASPDVVERESCRPDFVGLLCPWPAGQSLSRFPIDARMPPVFLCSALDDPIAPTSFAREIAAACERVGVPARLWIVKSGGHRAFTIGSRGEGARWVDHFRAWLGTLPTMGEK